jgi:hypothetical protein
MKEECSEEWQHTGYEVSQGHEVTSKVTKKTVCYVIMK